MSTPEPLPQSRSKAKTIAVVTVVVAFIAGLMIGVVGDRIWVVRHRDRIGMRNQRFMTERIVSHLDGKLHLTAQQREEVTRIVEARRQRISAITAGVRPQIWREIEEGNAEIEKVLTPEQRAQFEKFKIRMLPGHDHDHDPPGSIRPGPPPTEPGKASAPSQAGSQRP